MKVTLNCCVWLTSSLIADWCSEDGGAWVDVAFCDTNGQLDADGWSDADEWLDAEDDSVRWTVDGFVHFVPLFRFCTV